MADKRSELADHVYKQMQLTGSSMTSSDDAILVAIARASKTVRHMRWFKVLEAGGHIEEDRTVHGQVTVEIGFTLEQ